jgi:tetratricopeptide (TPR) repeat protein
MRILILGLAVMGLTWPATARADEQELARAHFLTGRSYYDQERYADALKEFEEAYRISKRVGFLYNIGVCDEKLGRDNEALTAYQGYLGSVANAAERADVQARIDALKAKRALQPPASTVGTTSNALIASPPPRSRPVWKRGWFWGVLTGTAAVVASAVAVGVVFGTTNHGPRLLPDVRLQ